MVRLVGPASVSSPLFYLSEINNYRFSSTPFFLISEDKLILARFKERRPRHWHQLNIVRDSSDKASNLCKYSGVDFLKLPGYCCELHQQEKIAISPVWLKWVKQERKKAGIEPILGQQQSGPTDAVVVRDEQTVVPVPCCPSLDSPCKLLAQDGADCITITLSTLGGDTGLISHKLATSPKTGHCTRRPVELTDSILINSNFTWVTIAISWRLGGNTRWGSRRTHIHHCHQVIVIMLSGPASLCRSIHHWSPHNSVRVLSCCQLSLLSPWVPWPAWHDNVATVVSRLTRSGYDWVKAECGTIALLHPADWLTAHGNQSSPLSRSHITISSPSQLTHLIITPIISFSPLSIAYNTFL